MLPPDWLKTNFDNCKYATKFTLRTLNCVTVYKSMFGFCCTEDFDAVPDVDALHVMRGTTPVRGLETEENNSSKGLFPLFDCDYDIKFSLMFAVT